MQSFIKIDATVWAVELPHTDTHTHTHTDAHTLIQTPSVSIATYSVKMTEYKKRRKKYIGLHVNENKIAQGDVNIFSQLTYF